MFKLTIVLFTIFAYAAAKAGLFAAAPVAYSAPLVAAAPAVVTAHSSQVIARNYNGLAAAPLVAAPVSYSAAYSAPVAYAASPYAYSAYAASPLAYSAYASAPYAVL